MRYVGVSKVVELIGKIGLKTAIVELAAVLEDDYRRWLEFSKSPRYAAHSPKGVVELMPIADASLFGCKYVNGHPANPQRGLQTVIGFGVLADMETGYPLMLAEMTIMTALRTAAMSAVAARALARDNSRTMAMIGLGSQSEFQAVAFQELLGINRLQVFDIDDAATCKFVQNMRRHDIEIAVAKNAPEATHGADIVTTVTADKRKATILSDNMVGSGVHINAIGGDCPGKTELQREIVERSSVFVEYAPQTRIEGEIQQVSEDFPVTELWEVLAGSAPGRQRQDQITLFDSVGFAIEDLSALRYLYAKADEMGCFDELDLLAEPRDPRDLYGLLLHETIDRQSPDLTIRTGTSN